MPEPKELTDKAKKELHRRLFTSRQLKLTPSEGLKGEDVLPFIVSTLEESNNFILAVKKLSENFEESERDIYLQLSSFLSPFGGKYILNSEREKEAEVLRKEKQQVRRELPVRLESTIQTEPRKEIEEKPLRQKYPVIEETPIEPEMLVDASKLLIDKAFHGADEEHKNQAKKNVEAIIGKLPQSNLPEKTPLGFISSLAKLACIGLPLNVNTKNVYRAIRRVVGEIKEIEERGEEVPEAHNTLIDSMGREIRRDPYVLTTYCLLKLAGKEDKYIPSKWIGYNYLDLHAMVRGTQSRKLVEKSVETKQIYRHIKAKTYSKMLFKHKYIQKAIESMNLELPDLDKLVEQVLGIIDKKGLVRTEFVRNEFGLEPEEYFKRLRDKMLGFRDKIAKTKYNTNNHRSFLDASRIAASIVLKSAFGLFKQKHGIEIRKLGDITGISHDNSVFKSFCKEEKRAE
jgi:hypothetical protein